MVNIIWYKAAYQQLIGSCLLFVSLHNILHQSMSYYVSLGQCYVTYSFDSPQHFNCLDHSAFLAYLQINLRYVAGYYHFGAVAQSCQDH